MSEDYIVGCSIKYSIDPSGGVALFRIKVSTMNSASPEAVIY